MQDCQQHEDHASPQLTQQSSGILAELGWKAVAGVQAGQVGQSKHRPYSGPPAGAAAAPGGGVVAGQVASLHISRSQYQPSVS